MTDELHHGFSIGAYRVLPREETISGPSGVHHVEPRVMQVLVTLAASQGRLVTRQALLDTVWSDAVVGDEVLSRAVSLLRGYFADERTRPHYIRTIPRRGYELIAPVGSLPEAPPQADPVRKPDPEAARRRRWPAGVALGVLVVAGIVHLLSTADEREPKTLAVLPPDFPASQLEMAFVGEGLADYLIDELSRNRSLNVVARRSSFGMRDTDANVRAIGDQLGARYLVESSLRADGAGLTFSLFLVDTDRGTNVWTTRLQGTVERLSQLQVDAAHALRAALQDELGVAMGKDVPQPARVPDRAYHKYLEARHQWTLRGQLHIARSIALLEEALRIEPNYAAAHLALAQSVALSPFYTSQPLDHQFAEARASVQRALALDASLAADGAALEGFMLTRERRWSEADATLRRALELDPDNVNARYWYSIFLSQLGRYDEALGHMEAAHRLDPVSAAVNDRLALTYLWVGDLERAAARYRVAADLGYTESTQPLSAMMFLVRCGRFADLEQMLLRMGGNPSWVTPVVRGLGDPRDRGAGAEAVDRAGRSDPILNMARFGIWVLYEDPDRAFRDFDPDPKTPYVEVLWIPEASHLRSDIRFAGLLDVLNFTGSNRMLVAAYLTP
jgi:TolB-like protein/DNA-binding winged helix-turn-helix (wHTH) protein